MKQIYIINESHPRLLLFFAGWACDETPFRQYRPQGMDYMVCYDYRTLDFDNRIFDRYQHIDVLGWSMGVWVASLVLQACPHDRVTGMAFNGSPLPIDDLQGIPCNIYQGTLDGLTPASLQKFMRRMCNDSQAYKAFMRITPHRNFDEIKEELACVQNTFFNMLHESSGKNCMDGTTGNRLAPNDTTSCDTNKYRHAFDRVYIGKRDRIFPPENLQRAFSTLSPSDIFIVDCAHYDETMFRFLLQEQWTMPFDERVQYLQKIGQETVQTE